MPGVVPPPRNGLARCLLVVSAVVPTTLAKGTSKASAGRVFKHLAGGIGFQANEPVDHKHWVQDPGVCTPGQEKDKPFGEKAQISTKEWPGNG
jgi:hypothetical protein